MKPDNVAIWPMSNKTASTAKVAAALFAAGLDSRRAINGTEIEGLLAAWAAAYASVML
ncbi:hypothetical protein [Polaromonas sp. CG_9.11]|uniref:hypothetical protein n=1 Tax=Polaromonas sp. CG_9.11 TaxID=2787730 RepID=UPI001A2CFD5F|nr:hypothetical protein [Polaromonas sp. CG_9.11]MBG6077628.1 hypothetical protein [Polaromonas sp. CG_9.11]